MDIKETKDIRCANRLKILNTIFSHKNISRSDTATTTELNKATVSIITKELIDLGLITESTIGDSTGGRKPILLTPCYNVGYIISVDLNVTHIHMTLANLSGTLIKHYMLPFNTSNFDEVFKYLCDSLKDIINTIPPCKYGLVGISIAVRGVVDLEGSIRFIPNLNWRNIPLKHMLEEEFNVPVYIDNDGNFTALAESKLTPAIKDLLVISIDDVISGGIIANGEIIRGFLGFANSVGHHIIDCNCTTQCSCGKYGCWEQYCSHIAILKHINKSLEVKDISTFIKLVKQKNKYALETLEYFIKYLTIGLTNFIFILNCEDIILNSVIISEFPYIIEEIQNRICLPITKSQNISISKLGIDAPLIGATNVAINSFFESILSV